MRHILLFVFLLSCGSGLSTILKPASELGDCNNIKDPDRPFIVEWSAADRGDLESMSGEGVVVVRYDGCQKLKILTECVVPGSYHFKAFSSPRLDSVSMTTKQELFASLPVGAVNIEGALGDGGSVDLRYILVGTQRSSERPSVASLKGYCEGASHYVSSLSVGAFVLEQRTQLKTTADTTVSIVAAASGERTEARRQLRQDGDVDECAQTQRCRSPVRVTLAPIAQSERIDATKALDTPMLSNSASSRPVVKRDVTHGGVLRVGVPQPMGKEFNLGTNIFNFNREIKSTVLERLMSVRPDGSTRLKLLEGRTVSTDGLTVRLRLKPGLMFHPHRCLPESREAQARDLLYSIQAFEELEHLKLPLATDKPVIIEDTYTVKFELAKRDVYLDEALKAVYLLPAELKGCADLRKMNQLTGTGPFRMTAVNPEGVTRLTRHSGYWRRDQANRRLPYLDALEFKTTVSMNEAMGELAEDQMDTYIAVRSALSPHVKDIHAVRPEFKKPEIADAMRVGIFPPNHNVLRLMNLLPLGTESVLADQNVRKAIAWAIDRKAVAAAFKTKYAPYGRILEKRLIGFDLRLEGYGLDQTKVDHYLKAAGYPKGKGLKPILIGTVAPFMEATEVLVHNLNTAGIPARLVLIDLSRTMEVIREGSVDAILGDLGYGFVSDEAPDVLGIIDMQEFQSTAKGGLQSLRTPRIDQIRATLRSTVDRDERARAYADMERAILDAAQPMIPLARGEAEHFMLIHLYSPRVQSMYNSISGVLRRGYDRASVSRP